MTPESTSAITTLSPVIESTIAEIPEDTVYDISDVESTINGIPEQTVYTSSTNPTTNEELVEKTIDEIPEDTKIDENEIENTIAIIPESTVYLPKNSNNIVSVDNFNSINNLSDDAKIIRQNLLDAIGNKTITLDGLVTYFKINKPSVYSEAINKISENYAKLVLNESTSIEKLENELFGTTITYIDFEKALDQDVAFNFYTDNDDVKYKIYINGILCKNGVLRISKEIIIPFAANKSLECCIVFEKEEHMPCSIILDSFSLQNKNINIELVPLKTIVISKSAINAVSLKIDQFGTYFNFNKSFLKYNNISYSDDIKVKYVLYDTNAINAINGTNLPGKLVDTIDNNIKMMTLLYIEFTGTNGEILSLDTNKVDYIIGTSIDSANICNLYELDLKYGKFKDTTIDVNKISDNNIYTYSFNSNKNRNIFLLGTNVTNAKSGKIRFLNKNTLIGKQKFLFNYVGFTIPVTTSKFSINNNLTIDNNTVTYDIGELNLLKNEKNSTEYLTINFSNIFNNSYTLKLNLLNADKLTNFPDTDKILFNCDLKDAYIFSPEEVTVDNLKLKDIYTLPLNDIIYKGTIENLKINGLDITGNVIFIPYLDLKDTLFEMRYFGGELKLYYNNNLFEWARDAALRNAALNSEPKRGGANAFSPF